MGSFPETLNDPLTLAGNNLYFFVCFVFNFFTVLQQFKNLTNNLRLNPKARVCSPSLTVHSRMHSACSLFK